MSPSSLYSPVKHYLEKLGFRLKGEICGCDLVALRADEPPFVIVGELKLNFSLELLLQGSLIENREVQTCFLSRPAYVPEMDDSRFTLPGR